MKINLSSIKKIKSEMYQLTKKSGSNKGKDTHLATQLIILFICFTIIPLLINSGITFNRTSRTTRSTLQEYSEVVINQLTSTVNYGVSAANREILSFILNPVTQDFLRANQGDDLVEITSTRAELRTLDMQNQLTNEFTQAMYVFVDDEVVYASSYASSLSGNKAEEYFNSKMFLESDIYDTMQDNILQWFYLDDEAYKGLYVAREMGYTWLRDGYVIAKVDEDYFLKAFEVANLDEGVPLIIVDEFGDVIFSNNKKFMNRPVPDTYREYMDELQETEERFITDVTKKGIYTLQQVENRWTIVTEVPNSVLLADMRITWIITLLLMIVLGILACIVSIVVAKKISAPITKLSKFMEQLKQGRLDIKDSVREEVVIGNIETGVLVEGFVDMLETLATIIGDARALTEKIRINADELQQLATNTAMSSEQVAIASDSVALEVQKEAEQVEHSLLQMQVLSENIESVTGELQLIQKDSKDILDQSQQTSVQLDELTEQSKVTIASTDKVLSHIRTLGDELMNMRNIIELITTINEQTNLLSLNAAIEAARAGDTGKGFAVVAEEIRTLSSETQVAIDTIEKVVQSIDDKKVIVLEETNNAARLFDNQVPVIRETKETFIKLEKQVLHSNVSIDNATSKLEGVKVQKQSVGDSLVEISGSIQHTASVSEEVSAETTRQTDYSDKINKLSMELFESVQTLNDTYSRFKQ